MLNLNWNINGANAPFGSGSHGSDYKPKIYWDYNNSVIVDDGTPLPGETNVTMSIYADYSNALNISNDSGNVFFTSEDEPITASISGSGVWPVTGSTTMSLFIDGFGPIKFGQPFTFASAVSYSAELNNGSVSSSIVESNFTGSKNFIYVVSGSVAHWKGNQYNPLVNWRVDNRTPVTTSFSIVKDENVSLVDIADVDGTLTGSFDYLYALGVTASITSSAEGTWSIDSASFNTVKTTLGITQAGKNSFSFSPNAQLEEEFSAQSGIALYNITASSKPVILTTTPIDYVIVGGGGGGMQMGQTNTSGAGGGAGALFTGSFYLLPFTSYSVVVGAGGLAGTDSTICSGKASSFIGDIYPYSPNISTETSSFLNAPGGGGGAVGYSAFLNGTPGGSGAGGSGRGINNDRELGGAGDFVTGSILTIGTQGGVRGRDAFTGNTVSVAVYAQAGGGGGVGGIDPTAYSANGGLGIVIDWLPSYINNGSIGGGGAAGGNPQAGGSTVAPGLGFNGGGNAGQNAIQYTGAGGGGASGNGLAGVGASGSFSLRYLGSPIATGGNIEYDGTYTYHFFTSSGLFFINTITGETGNESFISGSYNTSYSNEELTQNTTFNVQVSGSAYGILPPNQNFVITGSTSQSFNTIIDEDSLVNVSFVGNEGWNLFPSESNYPQLECLVVGGGYAGSKTNGILGGGGGNGGLLLTGSIPILIGFSDVTMSLDIPELGYSSSSYTTSSLLSTSFVSDINTIYDITASVELNSNAKLTADIIVGIGIPGNDIAVPTTRFANASATDVNFGNAISRLSVTTPSYPYNVLSSQAGASYGFGAIATEQTAGGNGQNANGSYTWLNGTEYAGGGGSGLTFNTPVGRYAGGPGGGNAGPGVANTGGGGAGADFGPSGTGGANGGSGVVILRYYDPSGSYTSTGGNKTTSDGYVYHQFNSNGTFSLVIPETPYY